MIISDHQLWLLAQRGLVSPFIEENLQGSSIDLTLGDKIKVETSDGENLWVEMELQEASYMLAPGEFILAHTEETVHIPEDCSAMMLLRSSAARAGYEHSLAGWCDPSFKGQLVCEIRNNLRYHSLPIRPGMRLLQLVLHQLDAPARQLYGERGSYQHQTGPTASNHKFQRIAS